MNHISEECVRGDVHTNTIENHWLLFKRGLIGSFDQVSVKHLPRYLAEFDYRTNHRKNPDLFIKTVARMCGVGPMQYKQLIAGRPKLDEGSVFAEPLFFSPAGVWPLAAYPRVHRISLCQPSQPLYTTARTGGRMHKPRRISTDIHNQTYYRNGMTPYRGEAPTIADAMMAAR